MLTTTAYAVLRWERRIALTGMQLQRGTDGQATLLLDGVTNAQGVQLDVPVGSGAAL
ncbi:MAG: hypothetical protein ABI171_21220 [Collimonas sp.]|uniref:hypothetical protein n=1 Tax=Collimonas sp. TaxID=1963772 RepID=UPI0032650ED8